MLYSHWVHHWSQQLSNFWNFTLEAGWQGDAVFKITFTKGGAIEFAEAFQRAVRNGKVIIILIYSHTWCNQIAKVLLYKVDKTFFQQEQEAILPWHNPWMVNTTCHLNNLHQAMVIMVDIPLVVMWHHHHTNLRYPYKSLTNPTGVYCMKLLFNSIQFNSLKSGKIFSYVTIIKKEKHLHKTS